MLRISRRCGFFRSCFGPDPFARRSGRRPSTENLAAFEQTEQTRVIYHAQKQANDRPDEHATRPLRGHSDDIVGGESNEGATTNAKISKDGSHPRREGENDAAQFLAETAGSPEGIDRKSKRKRL